MVLRLFFVSDQSGSENVVASIRNNQPKYILRLSASGNVAQTRKALRDGGAHQASSSHRSVHLSPVMG